MSHEKGSQDLTQVRKKRTTIILYIISFVFESLEMLLIAEILGLSKYQEYHLYLLGMRS